MAASKVYILHGWKFWFRNYYVGLDPAFVVVNDWAYYSVYGLFEIVLSYISNRLTISLLNGYAYPAIVEHKVCGRPKCVRVVGAA